jgi:hypothetical protein
MDRGRASVGEDLRYFSNRQMGAFRAPTPIRQARACTSCGYVEFYLDASELQKKLGA